MSIVRVRGGAACAGPVLLALSRDSGGRRWRLADAYAACARAMPNAAVVPDTVFTAAVPAEGVDRWVGGRAGPSSATRVREMLAYLAVALPACTIAAARLMAVH